MPPTLGEALVVIVTVTAGAKFATRVRFALAVKV
jgi:hypothetical protein